MNGKPGSHKWSAEYDTLTRQDLFANPPADKSPYPLLADAIRPHIESFDALLEKGHLLDAALQDIGTHVHLDRLAEEPGSRRNRLSLRLGAIYLAKASLPASNKFSTRGREIFPAECRERHATYRGKLAVKLEWRVNDGPWKDSIRDLGSAPIMLRSNRCHLQKLAPDALVQAKEESEELGGYWIINGNEKLIRMLIVPRRNYPMALVRPSFVNRGLAYTKYGIHIRCVRPDQSAQSNYLHYLSDGNVTFRFSWKKNEYLVPVVMIAKALAETNDREIFEHLVGLAGCKGVENTFLTDRVELLLRTYKAYELHGKHDTRAFLGRKFKPVLGVHDELSDYDAGTQFLRRVVLVHLGNQNVTEMQDRDKFQMLMFMVRKLYTIVDGGCAIDNPDAASMQDVLLPGFLYGMVIKERIEDWFENIRLQLRDYVSKLDSLPFADAEFPRTFISNIMSKVNENVGDSLKNFLSTGNLQTSSGLDLQQTSGFVVTAEKINFYRFISHFRCVHRGSFFAQLKTTTVRKLLPESWGFLCPVHTPDGSPCGLLNHLSHECRITTDHADVSMLPALLAQLGLQEFSSSSIDDSVPVQLDGRIIGFSTPSQARVIADTLRYWKVEGSHHVPLDLEIGHIPNQTGGQYPGVYLASLPSRMIRPVVYLPLDKRDLVGPFEQPFLSIGCSQGDIKSGRTTHLEYSPTNILSIVANQTPYSDFNQSPRNMYQCQMGKQAMGTPGTSLRYRTDNKAYMLQTGQTPIARPPLYNAYGLDNFPNGMNAVVAVISYTGYDMDDAMILSKFSHERGFGHGTIYKQKIIHLSETGLRSRRGISKLFGFAPNGYISETTKHTLDADGLPRVGACLEAGDALAASYSVIQDAHGEYFNQDQNTHLHKYSDTEKCWIESVTLMGNETGVDPLQSITIKLRIPRSPVIGDKFSSRHGQKGVCSQKWPTVDMPFSESGIVPDVIINPHAFPSRMTIGMFVESLAGKSGALHGLAQDSSPWRFSEEETASDYFGHQLRAAGYNYHGNEPMYSGITGREFAADIFVGVVFYQRLRHMVNDKFQVRTTGPVNAITGQPIKGRAKGGGIRVGEMERDALLAHGCAFLLQDRLLNCSDYRREWVCRTCGSFLSTQPTVSLAEHVTKRSARNYKGTGMVRCRVCARKVVDLLAEGKQPKTGEEWDDGQGGKWVGGTDTTVVAIPGVLRFLDVELAAMGVKLKYNIEP